MFVTAVFAFSLLQAAPAERIPQLDAAPVIDGRLDDAAWDQAARISLDVETWPAENRPSSVSTIVFVGLDSEYLYVAFDAEVPDPGRQRARYSPRDSISTDDAVGFYVDAFTGGRHAYAFFTNPLGIQYDAIYDDVTGGHDSQFDTLWMVETGDDDDGYVVEFAIPLKSIRGRPGSNQQWDMRFVRHHQRDDWHEFHDAPRDRARNCFICQFSRYSVTETELDTGGLLISPTLALLEADTRNDRSESLAGEQRVEAGADLRWDIDTATNLSLTVNPDFSQVEADPAQLTLNRQFPLFLAETRPFFIENRHLTNLPVPLVHTRNIAAPDWGLKLAGQNETIGYQVLLAQDAETNILLPGREGARLVHVEDQGSTAVLRGVTQLADSLELGAVFTGRSAGEYRNAVLASDMLWRPGNADTVTAMLAASSARSSGGTPTDQSAAEPDIPGAGRGTTSLLAYSHTGRNLLLDIATERLDKNFRADLGFVPQVGIERHHVDAGWRWWGNQSDHFRSMTVGLRGEWQNEQAGGRLQENRDAYLEYRGPYQASVLLERRDGSQWYLGREYSTDATDLIAGIRPSANLRFGLTATSGDAIDFEQARQGSVRRVGVSGNVKIGRHFAMDLMLEQERFDVMSGELYEAAIQEMRLYWHHDENWSGRLISRRSVVERNTGLYPQGATASNVEWANQILVTYQFAPRIGMHAGFSNGRLAADNEAFWTRDRTVFLKFSYAWQL